MAPTLLQYLRGYLMGLPLLLASIFYFGAVLVSNPLLPLSDFEAYKEKAFARMWLRFGPQFSQETPKEVYPLLAHSRGLILDVGPGSGEQLHRFTHPENIKAIYGVEPGVSLHEKLRASAVKAGLGDKYHVLGCTADLDSMLPEFVKAGLVKPNQTAGTKLQIFDEIVCIRVLCGVPDPHGSIADLYALLKPGGRVIVCEHVLNQQNRFAQLAQKIYMLLGWKQLMGGCELTRDTLGIFEEVAKAKDGGWAQEDTVAVDSNVPLVHIVGVLTKKG